MLTSACMYPCIPTGMHGPTCIIWAKPNTPFSPQTVGSPAKIHPARPAAGRGVIQTPLTHVVHISFVTIRIQHTGGVGMAPPPRARGVGARPRVDRGGGRRGQALLRRALVRGEPLRGDRGAAAGVGRGAGRAGRARRRRGHRQALSRGVIFQGAANGMRGVSDGKTARELAGR